MHASGTSLRRFTQIALATVLAAASTTALAQGPQDHRDDHNKDGRPQQGQGQGQNNNRPGPPQNNNRPGPPQGNNRPGPQNNFHFQQSDRGRFQSHYQSDANRWRNNPRRPRFSAGQSIPRNYAIQAVPSSYYRGAPPPPPGYRYGYYDGYVVSYNPTTRIIADVLDLLTGN